MSPSSAPIQLACTNCGAHVSVNGSTQTPRCVYCKTEMLLPEAIWRRFHPAPPPAGPQSPAIPAAGRSVLVISVVASAFVVVSIAVVAAVAGTARVTIPSLPSIPPNPIGAAGGSCNGRRAACSGDGKAELLCGANGTMAVAQTCRGPNGCRPSSNGKSVTCDTTFADLNDPCDIDDDACSTDHKAELRCQAGHFAVIATCKGPDGCTLTPSKTGSGYTLSCDDHVADVGDPCFDTERTACSSDKKVLLTCTAQRFAVHRACKRGCTVKKAVGTGNNEMDCE